MPRLSAGPSVTARAIPGCSAAAHLRGKASGWPVAADEGAKRVYAEDYESGKCDRIKDGSSAAVVGRNDGAEPHAGKFCLRGNFDPKTTDPITKKRGAGRYAGLANYVVGQGWGPNHWWICNNSPDKTSLAYQGNARVAPEQAELGVWHRVEFYLRLNSAPLKRDGVALLKIDGKLCIEDRAVPFIHSVPQTWDSMALPSMFGGGTPPRESFGWQLDDLEIWDGLPVPKRAARAE